MTRPETDVYLRSRVHDALDPVLPRPGAKQRVLAVASDRLARNPPGRHSWRRPLKTALGGGAVALAVVTLVAGTLGLTLSLRDQSHPLTRTSAPTLATARTFPKVATPIPIEANDGCSQQLVAFVNANTGWLALSDGVVARSTDGGASWVDQFRAPQPNALIQDIDFIDAQNGFAIVTWTGPPTPEGRLPLNRELIRTEDGGSTWSVIPVSFYNCLDFLSPSIGYSTTASGQLVVTSNGGTTWAIVPTPERVIAPCFEADGAGWVASPQGVYRTSDGGAHWELSYRPASAGDLGSADQLQCFSHTVWLLSDFGEAMNQSDVVIVRTLDNGEHWHAIDNQGVGGPLPGTLTAPQILDPHPGPFQLTGSADAALTSSDSAAVDVELTVTQDGGSSVQRHQVVSGSSSSGVIPVGLSFITPTKGWVLLSSETLDFHVEAWSGPFDPDVQLTGQSPTHLILLHTADAGTTWTQVATFQSAAPLS